MKSHASRPGRLRPLLAGATAVLLSASVAAQETTSLGETLQRHLADNWVISDVQGRAELVRVTVLLRMNPDGTVDGEPEVTVTDDGGQTAATVATYVQSVRTAIVRSQPFPLPAARYDDWRTIEISFNLKEESGK